MDRGEEHVSKNLKDNFQKPGTYKKIKVEHIYYMITLTKSLSDLVASCNYYKRLLHICKVCL